MVETIQLYLWWIVAVFSSLFVIAAIVFFLKKYGGGMVAGVKGIAGAGTTGVAGVGSVVKTIAKPFVSVGMLLVWIFAIGLGVWGLSQMIHLSGVDKFVSADSSSSTTTEAGSQVIVTWIKGDGTVDRTPDESRPLSCKIIHLDPILFDFICVHREVTTTFEWKRNQDKNGEWRETDHGVEEVGTWRLILSPDGSGDYGGWLKNKGGEHFSLMMKLR